MKKCLLLIAMVVVSGAVALGGCTAKSEDIEPPINTSTPGPVTPEPTDDKNEPPTLNIGYAAEALLETPDSYYEFIETDSEYSAKALLSTDTEVLNLRILALSFEETETSNIVFTGEELYSLDKLTKAKPLVVVTEPAETIPYVGVSYTDEEGNDYAYGIGMSGKDGSLVLSEIEMKK